MINKIEDRLKLIELEIDDQSSDLQLDADGYDTDLFLYHLFCYRSSLFGVPTGSLLAAQTSVKNLIKMGPFGCIKVQKVVEKKQNPQQNLATLANFH